MKIDEDKKPKTRKRLYKKIRDNQHVADILETDDDLPLNVLEME